MVTNPPTNYLKDLEDKELIFLWEQRVKRLKKAIEYNLTIWADVQLDVAFLEESLTRVEQEMGRRNMPIPGERTWK